MLITLGSLLWLASVGFPLALAACTLTAQIPQSRQILHQSAVWSLHSPGKLMLGSTFWAALIAFSALILAIFPAIRLATAQSQRSRRRTAALCVAVLCIPPYVTYWVWGLLRLPGSTLGDFLAKSPNSIHNLAGNLQLWLGLTLWVWPLAALPIAAALRRIPRSRSDLLALDSATRFRRAVVLLAEARYGFCLAFLLAFLAVLSADVVFDLASTQTTTGFTTFSEALRRLRAETASNAAVLLASIPMTLFALAVAFALALLFRNPPEESNDQPLPSSRSSHWISLALITISVCLPLFLMLRSLGFSFEPFHQLTATDGKSIIDGLTLALGAGLAFSFITLSFCFAWGRARRNRFLNTILTVQSISWVWVSLLPATTLGSAFVIAYNTLATSFIYESPIIVILGYLARFGFLPVLIGRWLAVNHAHDILDLAILDGAVELPDWLRSIDPAVIKSSIAAGFIGALLSLSEITTTIIITPPNIQSPAERLLNRLHYSREDAAMATCILITSIVFLGAFLAASWLVPMTERNPHDSAPTAPNPRNRNRRAFTVLLPLLILTAMTLPACKRENQTETSADTNTIDSADSTDPQSARRIKSIFGSTGRTDGKFIYARAIAADPNRKRLYILDRTGRLQLFDEDGNHLATWWMPKFDFGYATGITVQPDTGNIYVADTHNHRVLVFSPKGQVLQTFGEYGTNPGQFIFPTDIAFAPDGRIFVSEYGGNDRIQIFDSSGQFLDTFGTFGHDENQVSRPQSLCFDEARKELWVADSCNNRISIFNPETGQQLRTIGTYGTEPGTFCYPYGIFPLPDDSVLVAEFGNNRFQRIDHNGNSLETIGQYGDQPGQFRTPWSAAIIGANLYLLDSGNNRIQIINDPARTKKPKVAPAQPFNN